jgi:acyl carrier protein
MGSDSDTYEKLRAIIAKQLELDDASVITPESTFNGDLEVDSLDLIELVISIEDGFSIDIDDTTAGKIETVQDVINYLEEKMAE